MPVQKPSLAPRVSSRQTIVSRLPLLHTIFTEWRVVRCALACGARRYRAPRRPHGVSRPGHGSVAAAADARGASPSRDGAPARPDRAEVDARSPVPTSAMLHQGNPRVSNIEASVARRHQPGTRCIPARDHTHEPRRAGPPRVRRRRPMKPTGVKRKAMMTTRVTTRGRWTARLLHWRSRRWPRSYSIPCWAWWIPRSWDGSKAKARPRRWEAWRCQRRCSTFPSR